MSNTRLMGLSALLLGLAQGFGGPAAPRPAPQTRPVRSMPRRHRTTWAPAGGGRCERARRVWQIRAGTLNESNGLLRSSDGGQQ